MIQKFLVLVVVVLALIGGGLVFVERQQQQALAQHLRLSEPCDLEVRPGATPGGLFRQLEREGVLDGAFWLRLYWHWRLGDAKLPAGEYQLVPGESVGQMVERWHQGKVQEYRLTFPEGRSFHELRGILRHHPKLRQDTAGLSDEQVMARLGLADQSPEGWFFPDTYGYYADMSDLQILRKAHRRMQQVLTEEWRNRATDLPYKDPYQALIMASLVEKETGLVEERSKIAGVFVRRLNKGMLLQSDPTVIYGLGERYQGHIGRAGLDAQNPYNTYKNKGLPPTPIASPGRDAIHAALHPAPGTALYFVARGDGGHQFSDTLEEHEKAVSTYQLRRRQDYRSTPEPLKGQPKAAPASPKAAAGAGQP